MMFQAFLWGNVALDENAPQWSGDVEETRQAIHGPPLSRSQFSSLRGARAVAQRLRVTGGVSCFANSSYSLFRVVSFWIGVVALKPRAVFILSMVSTHSQYISDFNSPVLATVDAGKSPLAMLAKTCETIGLPDTPNRKSNKDEKSKDSHSPNSSSGDSKKDELSPVSKKKEGSKSPRHTTHSPAVGKKTPISSEPSTSSASLSANLMLNARNCFPMSFPPLATGFPPFPYPSMMPAFPTMPTFPGAFPTGVPSPFLRCPDPLTCKGCPATMMARPCVTPGCTSCTMHNPAASPADMMLAFTPSFFTAYNPLMAGAVPPTSRSVPLSPKYLSVFSSAAQIAYQNLMAAASGQTTKHVCNWVESPNGICGKSFSTADELATHMKMAHAPTTSAATSNTSSDLKATSPRSSATSLLNHSSLRYHPYMKPSGLMPNVSMPNPLSVPPFPAMPAFPSAAALQAMYAQRLMATIPHP
ncbi:unnamed protein product [Toxocara canis]|uniref:C2H2-type domain-containing protein n=1 Tax=Toxocara canis TaxID=6265 RepID=A0A183UEX6_TOXCA|nr:unnamed protein product [Toxocara canis]